MKENDVRKSLESIKDFAEAICQLNDWIKEWIMHWNCAYQAEDYTGDATDRYDWGFVDTYRQSISWKNFLWMCRQ